MQALARVPARPAVYRFAMLVTGVTSAALLRGLFNGHSVASAFAAGTAFGAVFLLLALAAGWHLRLPSAFAVGVGLAGAALLLVLPRLIHPGAMLPTGIRPEPFVAWTAITVLVATMEEVVFRGVLLDQLADLAGRPAAIAVTSLAFALIHVPLYGWGVVPLDVGVGVLFAGLRFLSGSVAAPAVAHVVADLATWWL